MKKGIILILVLIMGAAAVIYYQNQRPLVRYTCRVYRIDGTNEVITYTGRKSPSHPRWSRYSGWYSSFGDPTICRYTLLKIDTLKTPEP